MSSKKQPRGKDGPTFDTTKWDLIMLRLDDLTEDRVSVGVLRDEQTENGGSLATVAAVHELGTREMESRSYLQSTFTEHAVDEMNQVVAKLAHATLMLKVTPEQALGQLGAWAVGAVRRSITQKLIRQELKPATLARKAPKTTALVDTGQLINAIAWEPVRA